MSPESAGKLRLDWALAADGCLATAATFAVGTGIAVGLNSLGMGESAPGAPVGAGETVLAAAVALFSLLGLVAGPVVAWWALGRRFNKAAIIGGFLGGMVSGTVVMALSAVAMLFGLIAKLFTTNEFAGPIVALALYSIGFVAVVVWRIVDSVRDLGPGRRESVRRDISTLVSVVAVIAFLVVMALMMRAESTNDPEAGVFLLMAGVSGAVIVAGADLATHLFNRKAAQQQQVAAQPPIPADF